MLDVMHDQATRGQVLVLSETEAELRYPDLVIASLDAQRKEKAGGKITPVFFSMGRMGYR